jgi:EAL domain-containing protein (putative c-di-GMP-specific phosphodiesterase class I)
MYRAKQDGRSRWQVYDEALASEASSRLHLSKALRSAVEREELRLFYQPVVDMTDGSVRGYEALVRWDRPDHGLMGPGHFLEMAEETRDILAIGRWVVAEAARTFAEWRTQGLPDDIYMAVNVAAQQLRDPTFVPDVLGILADTGVPPASLLVELTEHTLVDGDQVTGALTRFRREGVRLALDDFGTGYSSLTQLESLPVDVVKVDRQFVVRLADGGDRHEGFLAALVKLVEALDLGLIVEGVETEDERLALLRAGFRTAQGYLFGRPAAEPSLPGAGGQTAAGADSVAR